MGAWVATLPAIIEVISDAVTSIAALGTVGVAFCGLRSWRQEMIGRRKAELAEEVLADFYRARDMIERLRAPLSFKHEMTGRTSDELEDEQLARRRDSYYVPLARLAEEEEFLAAFQAKRYRFQAVFGERAAIPFDEIFAVIKKVAIAARMLIETASDHECDVDKSLRL